MKKLSTITCLAFLTVQAFSQNTFPSSGDAGIGTTTPVTKLHISTDANNNTDQVMIQGSGSSAFMHLGQFANTTYFFNNAKYRSGWTQDNASLASWGFAMDAGNDLLAFSRSSPGSTGFADLFTVKGSGNVGIGTSNPGAHLQVGNDNAYPVNTEIRIKGGAVNATGAFGTLRFANADVSGGYGTSIVASRYGDNYGSKLNFNVAIPFSQGGAAWNNFTALTILGNGNVGIGTSTPNATLDIGGQIQISSTGSTTPPSDISYGLFPYEGVGLGFFSGAVAPDQGMGFWTNLNNIKKEAMRISSGGNVGIGTTAPAEKLAVNGKIRAKEIKVETIDWPDYVFNPEHKLNTLPEIEQFIKANKHLPEIPSAAEVQKDGINLGEMNAKLLKKVEELTLHLIEQDKKLKKQEQVIETLVENMGITKK